MSDNAMWAIVACAGAFAFVGFMFAAVWGGPEELKVRLEHHYKMEQLKLSQKCGEVKP